MKPPIHDASARQHSGGPSPIPGQCGDRNDQARKLGLSEVEAEIAGLLNRATYELRLAWREWRRAEPPLGLSRDLLIEPLPTICKSMPTVAPASRCADACAG
jgi:hypothetical protein